MPWIKAIPKMDGSFYFSLRDISKGKIFDSAKDCMDSFDRFEKDSSFGMMSTCRPIFLPLNDEELDFFNNVLETYKQNTEKREESKKMEELAETLIDVLKCVKAALKE